MLFAIALDGDNYIFPLTITIVDSDNDKFWEWFFFRLRDAIGEQEDLVIVFDSKGSIPKVKCLCQLYIGYVCNIS